MKKYIIFLLILFISTEFCPTSSAWDDKITHRDLTEYATVNSKIDKQKDDYLKNIGFDKGLDEWLKWNGNSSNLKEGYVKDWLREGAMLEDSGTKWDALTGKARFNNHFHNPLKPWAEAGLDDWVGLHYTSESSLLWAQDGNKQQSIAEYSGDWSWQKGEARV